MKSPALKLVFDASYFKMLIVIFGFSKEKIIKHYSHALNLILSAYKSLVTTHTYFQLFRGENFQFLDIVKYATFLMIRLPHR